MKHPKIDFLVYRKGKKGGSKGASQQGDKGVPRGKDGTDAAGKGTRAAAASPKAASFARPSLLHQYRWIPPLLGTPKAHKHKHFTGISLPYWASL